MIHKGSKVMMNKFIQCSLNTLWIENRAFFSKIFVFIFDDEIFQEKQSRDGWSPNGFSIDEVIQTDSSKRCSIFRWFKKTSKI